MSDFTSTLYSYDYYLDGGLFKNLNVPAEIDKDVLINVILMECGEMQPVWTNAEFMQEMIGVWSEKWQYTFQKWVNAQKIKYDPLYNYDRHEEIEDIHYNTVTNTGDIQGQKSAFDSSGFQPHDKTINNLMNQDNGNMTREAHLYGNIGIVSSQQMLQSEYDIAYWNIYDHIKDIFMQEFCIMIY